MVTESPHCLTKRILLSKQHSEFIVQVGSKRKMLWLLLLKTKDLLQGNRGNKQEPGKAGGRVVQLSSPALFLFSLLF